MSSRIKQSLGEIRKSLDKLLREDDQEERIFDELVILASTAMTPELIRESKLGKVISSIREKYDTKSAKVANKAKEILVNWKTIIENHKNASVKDTKTDSVTTEQKHHVAENVAKFNLSSSVSSASKTDLKSYISQLPATRRSIVNVFSNIFKLSANPSMADSIAVGIEEAIEAQFPLEDTAAAKQYTVKAKLLSFNIKKNEVLRENIISGHIAHKDLVQMSSAELASQEQKVARETLSIESVDERRLDWLAENKEALQLDIGIDPTNTPWEYDNGDDAMSEPDTDPPDI